ncbi:fructose-16-bisphosphatase chloroplastic-like [Trifolium medium]|uniref:Fructose-16-bisphosphatase chloroplastic-like n=1 Tax=Trifolium medium TaxID=97028 RepID=A0A392MIU8_9FABA|nr:fructose-16-bisphosphatase chloroplastic-like [Trifolium medium]
MVELSDAATHTCVKIKRKKSRPSCNFTLQLNVTNAAAASTQVFSNCLRSSGRTGIIASEEEDVPVAVEESYSGNYIVVFDPLDGSSNIDAAVSTGSIFGIYSPNDECLADTSDSDDPTVSDDCE